MSNIIFSSCDSTLVGAKAAGLTRLTPLAGVHVPPYFVVASTAFEAVIAHCAHCIQALETQSADSPSVPELVGSIQAEIRAAALPADTVDDIARAYLVLGRCFGEEDSLVSVRSSATAEDGATASFAGQYLTHLNVRGAAGVIRAVREVWASTYSVQAVRYRRQHHDSRSPVSMAVIVQRMVDAASAGTIYTVDPETGAPMICVNAVPGLGVADVSGQCTPTSWVIDPRTMAVIKRRSAAGVPLPIDGDTLLELSRRVETISAHFRDRWGIPTLELEFAVDRQGYISFTQARPETVWSQGKACLTAVDLDRAAQVAQVYQGGMTGCPGVVAGTLRLARTLAEAEAIAQVGDILVTPNTANIWEHLFGRIGGIVTEVGGTGSHTAVVMRELGKPALVGAAGAMEALATYGNRLVTLDATQRIILAGAQAAAMTHQLNTVTPTYGGADDQMEDASWAEASSQPGRTVTDAAGQRWIYKPEYPVCRFTQSVLLDAHRWIGLRLDVPVRNNIQGNIHRIAFADVVQWRGRLREMTLDDLEGLEQERESVMMEYLDACERFELESGAVQYWLDLYIRMNAFIGMGFPIYKVTEGLLEHALAQNNIVEPYYTQIRTARNGEREMESSRATRGLRELVAQALEDQRLAGAIAAACARQNDAPLKARRCERFYQQMETHARSYKVTSVAEIDLPLHSAVLAVARAIHSSLGGDLVAVGASTGFVADTDVEFFPEDTYLRRVHRLALAAEKARQDSHHLRVRGHWWIRDDLERLAEYLMGEGRISSFRELFDHSPDWLLQQVNDYRSSAYTSTHRRERNVR